MRIIDSHLHVWDTDRLHYDWLGATPELKRPFGFRELAVDLAGSIRQPDGYVFVQADCRPGESLAEVDWVSSLAADHPVAGIVAAAPLEDGDAVAARLDLLLERPLVVGVRRLLQSEPSGFALTSAFLAGAGHLAAQNLTFDACVSAGQLSDVTALADAVPGLRIVLDHLGKPAVAGSGTDRDARDTWHRNLAALAERPNVSCKLSGLPPQTGSADWTPELITPYLDAALELFGAERCMFGSDWPASSLQTTYPRWLDFVVDWTEQLANDERNQILSATAASFYRLG
ncbi:amidohydrolase family protein [Glaciibacter superstes]|uniref:amidohydrolase family protein n=1 Tax=Glaciibacter superstes TaxID=501023 RepID=UPI0003B55AD1|nr:amidohydrolase family protein [Glaciibacter superstes]